MSCVLFPPTQSFLTGSANIVKAGRVWEYTQGRVRAEQGTATSGILNYGVSNGFLPFTFQNAIRNNIYSETDHKVRSGLELSDPRVV